MIFKRIKNFVKMTSLIGSYTDGSLKAVMFLLLSKRNLLTTTAAFYKGLPFSFRGLDISAVREVLYDDEYAFIEKNIKNISAPVIVDAGAHIGLFALKVFSINENAQILSVEASPKTFSILSKTISDNKGHKWKALNAAAWSDESDVKFLDVNDSMGHRVSYEGNAMAKGVTFSCLINDLFLRNQEIDLMKIDIEGAEEEFLSTSEDYLKFVKSVVIELHPKLCDTGKVQAILEKHFKVIEKISGRLSDKPLLYCRN